MSKIEQIKVNHSEEIKQNTIIFAGILTFIGIIFICFEFFTLIGYNIIRVSGNSMYPTYHDGQMLILKTSKLENNDIVIFHPTNTWRKRLSDKDKHDYFIKRIVAHQGDTVTIKHGAMYVNNKKFRNIAFTKDVFEQFTVPKNKLFVMGDNYKVSSDSYFMYRTYHNDFFIDKSQIKFTAKGRGLKSNGY